MSYNWIGKIIEKRIRCKNRNNSRNQSEIVNNKPLARRRSLDQRPISNSTLKLE